MANRSNTVRPVRNNSTRKENTVSNSTAIASYNNLQTRQQRFIDTLVGLYGDGNDHAYTRPQVLTAAEKCGMSGAPVWVTNDPKRRAGRGLYSIPEAVAAKSISDSTPKATKVAAPKSVAVAVAAAQEQPLAAAALITEVQRFVPETDANYVPWGHFSTVRTLVKSKVFFPMWINGLSGNGKTTMVEQVCAKEGREFFRVNITEETDEDDLLGGFRLVNGDTVWQDGPVVQAMDRGAVLLLDELDLGSFKIMCLQPVLEGKGVFLKKIGRYVKPSKGFTIFATANTKGKGSDDGRFVGTRVQNEALLERFKATIDQPYPPVATEIQILTRECNSQGIAKAVYEPIVENLARWSDAIRKAFAEGACEDVISTRRLVAIVQAYAIYGDMKTAMNLTLARFDEDTRASFSSLYDKISATDAPAAAGNTAAAPDPNAVPF